MVWNIRYKLKKENDDLKAEVDYYKAECTNEEGRDENFVYEDESEQQDEGVSEEISEKYQFNETRKVYVSRESDDYFCPSCLQDGIESRLQKSTTGWQCKLSECNKLYSDPSFKLSKRKKS